MGQYDVAKLVLDADSGMTNSELVRQIDLSKSAVEASINDLLEKGYIVRRYDNTIIWNPEVSAEKIEDIRPRSLDELDF